MPSYGLDKRHVREITAQVRSIIDDSPETQTVYLRYLTGRTYTPSGRPDTAGSTTTSGPYKARVNEIKEADPYVLRGIGGVLGDAGLGTVLVGKSTFELNTDLNLESKQEPELLVVIGSEYAVYRPFKVGDKMICQRDYLGETLVTYYIVCEFDSMETI